jgi:hypothetical protein
MTKFLRLTSQQIDALLSKGARGEALTCHPQAFKNGPSENAQMAAVSLHGVGNPRQSRDQATRFFFCPRRSAAVVQRVVRVRRSVWPVTRAKIAVSMRGMKVQWANERKGWLTAQSCASAWYNSPLLGHTIPAYIRQSWELQATPCDVTSRPEALTWMGPFASGNLSLTRRTLAGRMSGGWTSLRRDRFSSWRLWLGGGGDLVAEGLRERGRRAVPSEAQPGICLTTEEKHEEPRLR